MAARPAPPQAFQVGQRVEVDLPPNYVAQATIVEDRGHRGPRNRHIWRVRIQTNAPYVPAGPAEYEVPEEWMRPAV